MVSESGTRGYVEDIPGGYVPGKMSGYSIYRTREFLLLILCFLQFPGLRPPSFCETGVDRDDVEAT